jgi:hypothetical protein
VKITVTFVRETTMEVPAIEAGSDFAVSERGPAELFVSTKKDAAILRELPGWKLLMGTIGGGVMRFQANLSRTALLNQFSMIYPDAEIIVEG